MGSNREFFKKKPAPAEGAPQQQIQLKDEKKYFAQKKFSAREMSDANHEILIRRNVACRKIETDARAMKETFEDIKALVDYQQPVLDKIVDEIHETNDAVACAEKDLLEAEEKQKRWCLIM